LAVAVVAHKSPTDALVALLLLVAVARHYAWPFFEPGMRGMASKGLGATAILVLMWAMYSYRPGKPLLVVLLWWTFEEAQVLLCSVAWLSAPWTVPVGQPICSALVGLDLGAFGVAAVALIVVSYLSTLTGDSNGNKRQQ
jgi:hypothetical protein